MYEKVHVVQICHMQRIQRNTCILYRTWKEYFSKNDLFQRAGIDFYTSRYLDRIISVQIMDLL